MKIGCFNWYLSHSGNFVTTLARAIQLADESNLARIKISFPQMVAAFKMNSWDDVPKDFEPVYDAKQIVRIL